MPKMPERVRKLYNYISQSNRSFKKMNMQAKRVQIAKDVLKQLQLQRMTGASVYFSNERISNVVGTKLQRLEDAEYCAGYDEANKDVEKAQRGCDVEIQDLLKTMPSCRVCGIGSAFIATVDRLNSIKIKDLSESGGIEERESMVAYLTKTKIFSEEQLDLIEEAFENSSGFQPPEHQDDGNQRLRNVMDMIIKTRGVIDTSTFPHHTDWYAPSIKAKKDRESSNHNTY